MLNNELSFIKITNRNVILFRRYCEYPNVTDFGRLFKVVRDVVVCEMSTRSRLHQQRNKCRGGRWRPRGGCGVSPLTPQSPHPSDLNTTNLFKALSSGQAPKTHSQGKRFPLLCSHNIESSIYIWAMSTYRTEWKEWLFPQGILGAYYHMLSQNARYQQRDACVIHHLTLY